MDQNPQPADAGSTADDQFVTDLLAEGTPAQADAPRQEQEPAAPPPAREPERIPLPEYLQERERRQDLERRLKAYEDAEKKKQEGPPEFWENPTERTQYEARTLVDPVRQEVQADRLFWSERFAVQEHGAETVQQAVAGLTELQRTNPAEYQRLEQLATNSRDPYGDVVRWHKQQSALREIGPDPAVFRQKHADELLKDPEHLAKAAEAYRAMAQGNPQFRPPTPAQAPQHQRQALPSMRTAGAAAPAGNRLTEQSGDDLLDEVFGAG